jgi:hypothetical protein
MPPYRTITSNEEPQKFSLEQFFKERDEIEYSLADAQEIYQP